MTDMEQAGGTYDGHDTDLPAPGPDSERMTPYECPAVADVWIVAAGTRVVARWPEPGGRCRAEAPELGLVSVGRGRRAALDALCERAGRAARDLEDRCQGVPQDERAQVFRNLIGAYGGARRWAQRFAEEATTGLLRRLTTSRWPVPLVQPSVRARLEAVAGIPGLSDRVDTVAAWLDGRLVEPSGAGLLQLAMAWGDITRAQLAAAAARDIRRHMAHAYQSDVDTWRDEPVGACFTNRDGRLVLEVTHRMRDDAASRALIGWSVRVALPRPGSPLGPELTLPDPAQAPVLAERVVRGKTEVHAYVEVDLTDHLGVSGETLIDLSSTGEFMLPFVLLIEKRADSLEAHYGEND
jgi:hypothetical protein